MQSQKCGNNTNNMWYSFCKKEKVVIGTDIIHLKRMQMGIKEGCKIGHFLNYW